MKIGNASIRRFVSGFFLIAALLMLVLGMTLLSHRLRGTTFLIYWLSCFLLTGAAAMVALIDMAILRHKLRTEQKKLIEAALNQTQPKAEKKASQKK